MNLIAPKPFRFFSRIEQSVVFPTLLWAPVTEIILNFGIDKGYRMGREGARCEDAMGPLSVWNGGWYMIADCLPSSQSEAQVFVEQNPGIFGIVEKYKTIDDSLVFC